jgi:hypothetical protein
MGTDVNGQERMEPPTDIAAYIDWILRGGRFDVHPPNEDGKANCIIRWMMETPSGWVGSWDKAALEQFVKPADDSAAYHGWVLREVLFDNGEPVGHREPRQASHKCIVKNCENHANQGRFVGDLCTPCHGFITTGEGVYSQAYRNAKREWVGLTDVEVGDALIELPILGNGYFLRIAKAIEAALKEKNT